MATEKPSQPNHPRHPWTDKRKDVQAAIDAELVGKKYGTRYIVGTYRLPPASRPKQRQALRVVVHCDGCGEDWDTAGHFIRRGWRLGSPQECHTCRTRRLRDEEIGSLLFNEQCVIEAFDEADKTIITRCLVCEGTHVVSIERKASMENRHPPCMRVAESAGQPVLYQGVEYPSLASVARALGISRQRLDGMRSHIGLQAAIEYYEGKLGVRVSDAFGD